MSDDINNEKYEQLNNLLKLLSGLFLAIHDFKREFRKDKNYPEASKKFNPIVFLRDDVFAKMGQADMNKWIGAHGYIIKWDKKEMQKLLAFRILKDIPSLKYEKLPFDCVWPLIFETGYVNPNNMYRYRKDSFNYMAEFTRMRPRDFIIYISKCAKYQYNLSSENKDDYLIKTETVKKIAKDFSNVQRKHIGDEIQVVLRDFDIIIKKCLFNQYFSFKELEVRYNEVVNKGEMTTKMSAEEVRNKLFDYSVIGIYNGKTNEMHDYDKAVFKYMDENLSLDQNKPLYALHQAIYFTFKQDIDA